MVFDPELKVWRGNEKILRKFRSIRRPKLIGPTENMVSELGKYFKSVIANFP